MQEIPANRELGLLHAINALTTTINDLRSELERRAEQEAVLREELDKQAEQEAVLREQFDQLRAYADQTAACSEALRSQNELLRVRIGELEAARKQTEVFSVRWTVDEMSWFRGKELRSWDRHVRGLLWSIVRLR